MTSNKQEHHPHPPPQEPQQIPTAPNPTNHALAPTTAASSNALMPHCGKFLAPPAPASTPPHHTIICHPTAPSLRPCLHSISYLG
ncbi:hypothetical protein ACHAXS_012413, partial [Conticribra weissflogii]